MEPTGLTPIYEYNAKQQQIFDINDPFWSMEPNYCQDLYTIDGACDPYTSADATQKIDRSVNGSFGSFVDGNKDHESPVELKEQIVQLQKKLDKLNDQLKAIYHWSTHTSDIVNAMQVTQNVSPVAKAWGRVLEPSREKK